MPVIKVESNSGLALLVKLGVPASHIGELKTKNIVVKLGVKDIKFYSAGETTHLASASLQVLVSSVMKGSVPIVEMQKASQAAKHAVEAVLSSQYAAQMAIAAAEAAASPQESPGFEPAKETHVDDTAVPVLKMVKKTYGAKAKAAEAVAEGVDANPSDYGPPVELRHATGMYQPVKGTDSSSVYRVIAISKDGHHKVAARVKKVGTVSFRIESTDMGVIDSQKQALVDMGFSKKGEYWSMHASINSEGLLKRVIGSTLGGLPFQLKTTLPDVKMISEGVV